MSIHFIFSVRVVHTSNVMRGCVFVGKLSTIKYVILRES